MPMWGWNDLSWWAMAIWMVVFWSLVIVGIVLAVRALPRTWRRDDDHGGPRDILEERFARGEIDEDEFKRRRELLST